MDGYRPVPLGLLCNARGGGADFPRGARTWHGLPFLVGPEAGEGPDVIELAGGAAVTVPVGGPARSVVVAHRLLESRLKEGDPVGRPVADYAFVYADGSEEAVPVRERIEIGVIPCDWGQWPILAAADDKGGVQPRYEGRWGGSGYRQTEAYAGGARWFYLLAWINPRPDIPLAALAIRARGPKFHVGAVTLGTLDEHPLRRGAKREVKIELPRPEDAGRPFALEVEVDRGVAGYPHALPAAPPEAFLADPLAGWGEEQNAASSPAYVEVSAVPSATLTVKQNGEVLGTARWGELAERGRADPNDRLRLVLVDRGRNWVRTTVVDDETGKPVPCRIHFRSLEGIPFPPHGHHTYVNSNLDTWHVDVGGDLRLGQATYAYINGRCEGWLPRGEVIVDVARGFEYRPVRTKVAIAPGQRELAIRLARVAHPAKEGWYSGDTHVHFLSTRGGHLEAAGEGLNVVNLLLSQWGHLFTNTEEFTGRPDVAPGGETIVYATQENRQHILGHLSLLGLKEPVMPWCSDGPDEAELGGNLETTLCRWADACRAQGGTVVIPHLPTPNCEPAALIATGRADAVEMLVHDPYNHLEYYRYLNGGYRLPLTGGTDKMTANVPVGLYRTYVSIPEGEPFTYENWCKALRAGRTFHSGGPLIRLRVEGRMAGDTVELPGNGGTLNVEASADSIFPIHALEIVMNGNIVARTEEKAGARALKLSHKLPVQGHAWIAARCAGPGYTAVKHHDGWRRGIMAHTSPVYVAVGGPWRQFDPETARYMLTLLHAGIDYLRRRSVQWTPGMVTHHHGRDDHMAFLEEPFREAIDAVHRRLHEHGIAH